MPAPHWSPQVTLTKYRIFDFFETFSIIASTLKHADHPRKVHWDAGALAAATCFLHVCCSLVIRDHEGFPNSRTVCCLEVGASKISRSLLGHWNTSGSQVKGCRDWRGNIRESTLLLSKASCSHSNDLSIVLKGPWPLCSIFSFNILLMSIHVHNYVHNTYNHEFIYHDSSNHTT